MKIRTAKFIKGVIEDDEILRNGKPQIAFIGRSNVGKSSVINSFTKQKGLAKTSSLPGRTRQINVFLINKSHYLLDLPGYGYARTSWEGRELLKKMICWYLFETDYEKQKIVLIIDANVGLTYNDLDILQSLDEHKKDIVIVANKVDKIKKSAYLKQLQKLKNIIGKHKIIPYSAEKGIGNTELNDALFIN